MTSDDLAPAAWRYLVHGEWFVTNIRGAAEFRQSEGCVVEPLYTTLAQPDAEAVAITDEMVMAACDILFERTSIAFGGNYMREALEAALDPKQVGLYTAPPRHDADADFLSQMRATEFLGEPDDSFERHQNARISKLEREIAELTLEQRTVFDAGIDARSDVANAALAQSDAEPVEEDKPLGFRTNDVPDPYAEGPQSDAEQEPDDNFGRHQNARIPKLEHEMEAAGLATRNPAPNAAPSSYSNTKTITIGGPAFAQSDAEPVGVNARDIATKIASRPALAKLIDTGALKFDEMCDLRDDIERALRSRAADRSGENG